MTQADRLYVMHCAETGAYVDPLRLSARLRERVDAQALRQRPVVDGREHYYVSDVLVEFDDYATGREMYARLARSGPPLDATMQGLPRRHQPRLSIGDALNAQPVTNEHSKNGDD
ncbi:hypothetical protein ACGYK5_15450 [Sulfitobacter sp. 1A16787]|uniref:hypothetical protein n=1 Tax=Sulfitobacter sp. 1A16787 TaxID=3368571 RepID=UPI0037451C53